MAPEARTLSLAWALGAWARGHAGAVGQFHLKPTLYVFTFVFLSRMRVKKESIPIAFLLALSFCIQHVAVECLHRPGADGVKRSGQPRAQRAPTLPKKTNHKQWQCLLLRLRSFPWMEIRGSGELAHVER